MTRLDGQTGILFISYLACLLILLIVHLLYRRKQRDKLNRNSIKEAVDTLPMAVCYFLPSGMVKLCNKQMEALFRMLSNTDLQSYAELVKALAECGETTPVHRLEEERNIYLFPDGTAWHYMETEIKTKDKETYTQALFTNVTELYDKGLELKAQSRQLRRLALDLKQLSDHALVIARENEILTAKTRLHDQMGAGLTAVRQLLLHNAGHEEAEIALRPLRRAISLLKENNNEASHRGELAELIQDADSVGIKIELNCEETEQQEMKPVLILALRECLTNAARHADATVLRCTVRESNGSTVLLVTNDGIPPADQVQPKGGLRNLLRVVNNCGGAMSIQSKPFFALTVTIPSERQ